MRPVFPFHLMNFGQTTSFVDQHAYSQRLALVFLLQIAGWNPPQLTAYLRDKRIELRPSVPLKAASATEKIAKPNREESLPPTDRVAYRYVAGAKSLWVLTVSNESR